MCTGGGEYGCAVIYGMYIHENKLVVRHLVRDIVALVHLDKA